MYIYMSTSKNTGKRISTMRLIEYKIRWPLIKFALRPKPVNPHPSWRPDLEPRSLFFYTHTLSPKKSLKVTAIVEKIAAFPR